MTPSLGNSRSRRRARVILAPTASWWRNVTPPCSNDLVAGSPMSWNSADSRRRRSAGVCAVTAMVPLPAAFWLGGNAVERALLIGTVLLVLIVELLNTAVEYTVDRIGTDHHRLSGRAKDAGSAAVLLTIGLAILVWVLVLTK